MGEFLRVDGGLELLDVPYMAVLINHGPDTLSYGTATSGSQDTTSVSLTSTLVSGATVTLTTSTWLRSAGRSRLYVEQETQLPSDIIVASTVPTGGTTGQPLIKNSGTSGDVGWGAVPQPQFNFRGAVAGSTTYNAGDVLIYRGRRILATATFTTSSAPVTFISAVNYVPLAGEFTFNAADWGSLGGTTADVAIQAALNEAFNMGLGATILLPEGVFVTSTQIDIPWGCTLEGAGKMSTVIQPADGSDLVPIRVHKSTGSGNANAMFAAVRRMGINGRKATMSSATAHGLILETNPLISAQSGTSGNHVEFFDPHHTVEGVAIRSCLGNGLHMLGRSAHHIRDVWCDSNDGYGFFSTFDTTFVHCEASGSGKAGFFINNGSVRAVGCKSYTNGRLTTTEPGYDIGSNGNFATLLGCDSQNNGGPGYRVAAASAVTIFGTADGNGLISYGAAATTAVELNGAIGAIINVGAINSPQGGAEIGAQRYGLKMTSACAKCSIVMSNAAVAPATILGDVDPASVISAGNSVRMNGSTLTEKVSTLVDTLISSPSDGQVFAYDGASGKWKNSSAGAASFASNAFGDGSDGAVNMDGTNTFASFASKAGNVYTLTRDVFATNLTIAVGVTLRRATTAGIGGFRVFCTGTYTNNGTDLSDGNDGTTSAGGATASGLPWNATTAGGAGGTSGVGTSGQTGGYAAGAGGGGGAGSSTAGGSGGASQGATATYVYRVPQALLAGVLANSPVRGGGGGAGGGGDGTNRGGGGGSGAGVLVVFARTLVNTGALSAKGGNGSVPSTGNCGGGGGGGGSAILLFSTTAWTNSGTTAVTGGTGAAGTGTGSTGTNGGAGTVTNIVLS